MMGSESVCKDIMAEGSKNPLVKELFNFNKPSISPYIPKTDINNYKNAVKSIPNNV